MRNSSCRMLIGIGALALAACESSPERLRPDGGPDAGPPITYYEHVRPILVENCTMCHAQGGIAPFTLETYEAAREVADRIAEVTRERVMPPFLADNSGECNRWANHRGLTEAQIATIGAWVDRGAREGDSSIPAPTPVTLPTLPTTDLTLEMPDSYAIRSQLPDDYRCFVVDVPTDTDVIVRGYDVQPGNVQRVHHVIVYNPADEAAVTAARQLDQRENGMGYECFGGPRVDASPLVLWAPGTGATVFPRDAGTQTGVRVEARRAQVIQIHYNNAVDDSPNDDRTRIHLSFVPAGEPSREAYFFAVADVDMQLPPRREHVETSATFSLPSLGAPSYAVIPVWGVLPHMHTLGRTLTVERLVGGNDADSQCLIDVPRWDFNWQLAYFLARPILVTGSDSLRITCGYNTQERDEIVRWGEGTQDEMCLAYFYVVPPG